MPREPQGSVVPTTTASSTTAPDGVVTPGPAIEPEAVETLREPESRGMRGTRTAHTWTALAAGMFLLVVVLVFILQNLASVRVHFLWLTWTIPLAVDLLLATVLGGLIMFSAGSVRIVQLRRAARRNAASRR